MGDNEDIITDAYATGTASASGYGANVGGLVGDNENTITDAYATGTASASGDDANVGGLAGYNGGTIQRSYATGAATAGFGAWVGGLVGQNDGNIEQAYATGSATAGEADMSYTAAAGGLVGHAGGGSSIYQAYATGAATVGIPSTLYGSFSGGLVGFAEAGSSIEEAYATGAVTAGVGGAAGGLAGNSDGDVDDAYWDVTTTGQSAACPGDTTCGGGALVLQSNDPSDINSDYAFAASSYDWDIYGFIQTRGWLMIEGGTRPFLAFEYSTSIANAHQLQLAALAPYADYTLAADIDLTGALADPAQMWLTAASGADAYGFVPIGGSSPFSGTFDGQGHTISGLVINENVDASGESDTTYYVGLFGLSVGTIRNVGLVGGSVTGALDGDGTDWIEVGALAGENDGTIANAYATADVAEQNDDTSGDGGDVGGLVGDNFDTITDAYAAGTVTGGDESAVGGLIGYNDSTISDAYATGVASGGVGSAVGGLVGGNDGDGTITDAYATGAASGGGDVGGLVGDNNGAITSSYWDTTTPGRPSGCSGDATCGGGATGLTTLAWLTEGPVATAAWDTTGTWVAGYPYPVLAALPYVLITATGTQTYGTPKSLSATISAIADQDGNDASALVDTAPVIWLTSATAASGVAGGPYVIGGTDGGVAKGYQLTYDGADTVTPAVLTVTAKAETMPYGSGNNFTAGFTSSGLVGSETIGAVSYASNAPVSGSGNWQAGVWRITPSAATGGTFDPANYAISYAAGTLTVNRAALTIAAGGIDKVYDGTNSATVTLSDDRAGGDVFTDSYTSASFADANAGVGKPVSVTRLSIAGADAANYTANPSATTTAAISPVALTIIADDAAKTYGQTLAFTGDEFVAAGLVKGETVGSVMLTSAGAAATASVAGSPYEIDVSAATGGTFDPANYDISYVPGMLVVSATSSTFAFEPPQPFWLSPLYLYYLMHFGFTSPALCETGAPGCVLVPYPANDNYGLWLQWAHS